MLSDLDEEWWRRYSCLEPYAFYLLQGLPLLYFSKPYELTQFSQTFPCSVRGSHFLNSSLHVLPPCPLSFFPLSLFFRHPKTTSRLLLLPPLAVVTPSPRTLANFFPPLLFRRPHRNLEIAHISLTGIYLMGSSVCLPCGHG